MNDARCDFCDQPVPEPYFVDDRLMLEVNRRLNPSDGATRVRFVFCNALCTTSYALHLGAAAGGARHLFRGPVPAADAPRADHELYTLAYGYFWVACRNCGRMFGGHEIANGGGGTWWTSVGGGHSTCTNCPGSYNEAARECKNPECKYPPCVEER
jgi:hypothetical protein